MLVFSNDRTWSVGDGHGQQPSMLYILCIYTSKPGDLGVVAGQIACPQDAAKGDIGRC